MGQKTNKQTKLKDKNIVLHYELRLSLITSFPSSAISVVPVSSGHFSSKQVLFQFRTRWPSTLLADYDSTSMGFK